MNESQKKEFLTIAEFANEISAHHNTIRNMIKSGRISSFRLGGGPRSTYRIPRSEINRLALVDLEKLVSNMVQKRIYEKGEK